jgi:hypothetical protein
MHAETKILAFQRQPLTYAEATAVRALMNYPNSTSSELSQICGWGGQSWNGCFGKMCKAREETLGPAPPSTKRDTPFYSVLLADYDKETANWSLKPEALDAFIRIGL